jgi:polyhydroxyalkanoate synthesis regulator phasin
MDEPDRSPRDRVERLGLAAVGAVALTAERIEELTSELVDRGGMKREDARQLLEDAVTRWRGDATRFAERAGDTFQGLFVQLGLVPREEYEELELRLAQVEHRLRLVEESGQGRAAVQD